MIGYLYRKIKKVDAGCKTKIFPALDAILYSLLRDVKTVTFQLMEVKKEKFHMVNVTTRRRRASWIVLLSLTLVVLAFAFAACGSE